MNLDHLATIQWFPGHMTKTLRLMQSELKNVDLVIELLDSRIPKASKNPELERMAAQKPKLLLLNKSDLGDAAATARWIEYYKKLGYGALAVDSKSKNTAETVTNAVFALMADRLDAQKQRGMVGARLRAMVVGIPNVGKSTFINNMAGGARAKVADKPGVTRGKQWVSVKNLDLLDMPGVLWPKFDDKADAVKLAITGAIRDEVLDVVDIAAYLLEILAAQYPDRFEQRLKAAPPIGAGGYELLELAAQKRGMLLKGGEPDYERAAVMILDEFRGAKFGRITLEEPPDEPV